jgi:hypothetical protein
VIRALTGAAKAASGFLGSSWWVLLGLTFATGWFWADAQRARADRDAWAGWGAQVCAFTGTTPEAATVQVATDKGKRRVKKARGQLCSEAVQDLASFKAQTIGKTAETLATTQSERETKTKTDISTASRDAVARREAVSNMEKADAEISDDDRVDGDWFAGINDLGGLR